MKAQEIMEYLKGNEIAKDLAEYLEQNSEDFSDVRKKYISALERLENELKESESTSVQSLVDAIEQQVASTLIYSCALGMKANLDHFLDPMARTVLDVDFDVFLRENTARRLPEFERAQAVIENFFKKLPPEQRGIYNAIIEYISYLETAGPKLVHYFGFTFGDALLYRLVPGYHPDHVLTMRYRSMLDNYFGKSRPND